jgi:hypothetical protein
LPKLGLSKLVEVFPMRGGVVGIIHTYISWWFTACATFLEVLTVSPFEDVYLRKVDAGVIVAINCTIPGTQAFYTENNT